jgi:hypothetical protein
MGTLDEFNPHKKPSPPDYTRVGQSGKPLPPPGPARPPLNYGLADALLAAPANLPMSTARVFIDMYNTVSNPVGTAKDLYKVYNQIGLTGIGKEIIKPYTDYEEFKRTLAEDPARILLDVSTLAGGVGVAAKLGSTGGRAAGLTRTARVLQKAGNAASKVSRGTDPLVGAAKVIKGTGNLYGTLSGAGARAPSIAHNAIAKGGEAAQSFWQHKRGVADPYGIAKRYGRAVGKAQDTASNNYALAELKRKIATYGQPNIAPDWTQVDAVLADIGTWGRTGSQVYGKAKEIKHVKKITDIVENWKKLPPTYQTPEKLDKLRKKIYNLTPYEKMTPTQKAATDKIVGALADSIEARSPGYKAQNQAYSSFMNRKREVEAALGQADTPSKQMRATNRLQGSLRDNVLGSDVRRDAVRAIKDADPGLEAAIAGTQLQGATPRGIMGWSSPLEIAGIGGMTYFQPGAALGIGAGLIPTSPGALGYLSAGTGALQRPFEALRKATGAPVRTVPHAAAQASQKVNILGDMSQWPQGDQ